MNRLVIVNDKVKEYPTDAPQVASEPVQHHLLSANDSAVVVDDPPRHHLLTVISGVLMVFGHAIVMY